ncbi:MAG: Ig-like domain-containing protein [Eubacteriales bacterium]|nr:Ig-like domain-containing protein [Eubacteriales bacterium]
MKKRRFWMLLMALVCLLAFGMTASAAEKRTIVGDIVVTNGSDALGQKGSVARSRTTGTFSGNFGDQLTGNARKIYDALCAADMKGYTVDSDRWLEVELPSPYVFTTTTEALESGTYYEEASYLAAYNELHKDAQKAIDAFRRDQSDAYWIYWIRYDYSFTYEASAGSCQIPLKTLYFQAYAYYDGILEEASLVDSALAAADAAIRERRVDSSRYETIKAIHDYAAELITYGNANQFNAYEHTITGGLLSKYNHVGVCECYAKLVKTLCDRFSVPCAVIAGGSELNADGTLNVDHMWNVVQMEDGKWYLLDATWDDQDWGIAGEYFLAGSNSIGFDGRTIAQDHMMVSSFSGVDYDPFVMPTLASEAYRNEEDIPLTGITLNTSTVSLAHGSSQTLTVSYAPANTTDQQEVTWISSDSSIAQVDSQGKVTAGAKAGTATITAVSKAKSTIKATCTVKVTHIEGAWKTTKAATIFATGTKKRTCTVCGKTESKTIAKKSASVKLNVSTLMLQVKKSTTALTIKKKTSGDSVKKWTSSKPAVAAVNSRTGKITAKKTGTTVITVTMKSGAVAKCTVKVQKNPVKTTKLTLNKKKVTLAKGKSLTLQVTRNPLTANDKLTWKSSNAKIVKVNSKGKIQALKKGKATITVKAASGKKATCTVTVK